MQVPEEEKYLNSKAELHDMIVGLLGGRAAEEIVFDTVTTGASNDIERATNIARAMVTQYGMSKRFGLMGLATQENQYLSGRTVLNCGDDTATEVDHEVMVLLLFLHIFYLLMDSVVVGRSLDIADNSKGNGESMLIVHHGKLQL